jgi:hypothetical protein
MSVIYPDFKEQSKKNDSEIIFDLVNKFDNGFLNDFFLLCEKFYIINKSIRSIKGNIIDLDYNDEPFLEIANNSYYEFSRLFSILFYFFPALIKDLEKNNKSLEEFKNRTMIEIDNINNKLSQLCLTEYTLIDNVEDIISESKKLTFESIYYNSFLYNNFILNIKNDDLKLFINNEHWNTLISLINRYRDIVIWKEGNSISSKHEHTLRNSHILFDYTQKITFIEKIKLMFKYGSFPILNKTSKRNKLLKLFLYN